MSWLLVYPSKEVWESLAVAVVALVVEVVRVVVELVAVVVGVVLFFRFS